MGVAQRQQVRGIGQGGSRTTIAAGTVKVLTLPIFIVLGEASYSIYILHIPLRYSWDSIVDAMPGLALPSWLHFLLYFGFVFLVSVVVFRQVETPLRQWIAGRGGASVADIPPVLRASDASSARA